MVTVNNTAYEVPAEIYLGRVVKAFGIKGELKFLPSDDFWGEVLGSNELFLYTPTDDDAIRKPIRIERSRPHGGTVVLKVEGVDDRNAAEDHVGSELFIATADIDVPLPDFVLPFQVVGRTVRTEDGRVIGRVGAIMFSAAHDVYQVMGESGEVLIPAVEPFIVGQDEDTGDIVIRDIPGLLDTNA